jgi:hypothetical protein
MEIKPTHITFEQAKWLKKKGFNEECIMFYTQPNSKMFGIDEHGRYYSIKNKPKTLWIVGNVATLNIKNVLLAPEQHVVIEWLRVNHGIWIYCKYQKRGKIIFVIEDLQGNNITISPDFNSPQEAYSAAFDYVLNNLI